MYVTDIPLMAPVLLVATFGQYFLTLVRYAFLNNCFARCMNYPLKILSVLILGIKRKIDTSFESIIALSPRAT